MAVVERIVVAGGVEHALAPRGQETAYFGSEVLRHVGVEIDVEGSCRCVVCGVGHEVAHSACRRQFVEAAAGFADGHC